MKIIPKGQNGLVVKSDNTKVVQRPVIFPIKYKIKPGEIFVTDRATGKKVLIRQKNETVSANRKSTYQEQQDQKKAQQVYKQYEENKNQEEGMKNIQGLLTFLSPSTYIGPIFNNNGKSYVDNVISGEGTGDTAGNMAIDMLTPFAIGGVGRAASKLLPKTATVYKGATQSFNKSAKIRKINKELNKGIKENSIIESYNKIAANKDIGTAYDYLDFLDNIFPKSKMNGVYYHGGPKGITQFESAKNLGRTNKGINSGTKDYGIYFADDKVLAKYYASTHPKSNREVYTVKLNMDRPVKINTNNWYLDKFKGTQDFAFDPGSITQKWYDKLNLKQYNSIYHNGKNPFSDGEIVMFNPEDIHIMGTPQESAMFREYKRFPIKRQVQLNEDIPTMQQQYDFGFKNIIKAAKPGVVIGTPLLVSSGLLIYELNRKRNKEREAERTNK